MNSSNFKVVLAALSNFDLFWGLFQINADENRATFCSKVEWSSCENELLKSRSLPAPRREKRGPDCLYLMGNNQHHHLLLGTLSRRNNMWHDALEMFGPFSNTAAPATSVWHICKHDKERARSRKDKLTRAHYSHCPGRDLSWAYLQNCTKLCKQANSQISNYLKNWFQRNVTGIT